MKAEIRQTPYDTLDHFLEAAGQRTPVLPKDEFIVEVCRGKNVLDMGCIDHSWETAVSLGENWLHHRISKAAKSVVGLDLLAEDAKILNQRGYNIKAGNAESFDLGQTFDVLVAGDLIEHLSDIGSFLRSVRKHMRPDSLFVVTTPNPFNVEQMLRILARNRVAVHAQHTAWLDPAVAWELFRRSNMEIVDFRWVDTRFKMGKSYGPRVQALLAAPLTVAMWLRPLLRRDFGLVLRPAPNGAGPH